MQTMFNLAMNRRHIVSCVLAIGAVMSLSRGDVAFGQADPLWGAKMFEVTEVSFGSVAKGAESTIQLRVKNIYKEDIQITNLATGCSCVSWDDLKAAQLPFVVPSGQNRMLTLRLDTIRYDGERKSKATITLLDPVHGVPAIVDLPVTAYIRKDIVITPGAVNFGTVDQGSGAERKIEIRYAGRPDWKLLETRATNPNLQVSTREVSRAGGLVNYELTVVLKSETVPGTVRDQIVMVTDDANNPKIYLLAEGKVEADIAVTDVSLGTVTPGQSKTTNVVIRGKRTFKIEELYRQKKESSILPDDAFKVKLSKSDSTVHSLPVTFIAPDAPGAFEEDFFVKVSDRAQPIPFKVRGRILQQTGAAKQ